MGDITNGVQPTAPRERRGAEFHATNRRDFLKTSLAAGAAMAAPAQVAVGNGGNERSLPLIGTIAPYRRAGTELVSQKQVITDAALAAGLPKGQAGLKPTLVLTQVLDRELKGARQTMEATLSPPSPARPGSIPRGIGINNPPTLPTGTVPTRLPAMWGDPMLQELLVSVADRNLALRIPDPAAREQFLDTSLFRWFSSLQGIKSNVIISNITGRLGWNGKQTTEFNGLQTARERLSFLRGNTAFRRMMRDNGHRFVADAMLAEIQSLVSSNAGQHPAISNIEALHQINSAEMAKFVLKDTMVIDMVAHAAEKMSEKPGDETRAFAEFYSNIDAALNGLAGGEAKPIDTLLPDLASRYTNIDGDLRTPAHGTLPNALFLMAENGENGAALPGNFISEARAYAGKRKIPLSAPSEESQFGPSASEAAEVLFDIINADLAARTKTRLQATHRQPVNGIQGSVTPFLMHEFQARENLGLLIKEATGREADTRVARPDWSGLGYALGAHHVNRVRAMNPNLVPVDTRGLVRALAASNGLDHVQVTERETRWDEFERVRTRGTEDVSDDLTHGDALKRVFNDTWGQPTKDAFSAARTRESNPITPRNLDTQLQPLLEGIEARPGGVTIDPAIDGLVFGGTRLADLSPADKVFLLDLYGLANASGLRQ